MHEVEPPVDLHVVEQEKVRHGHMTTVNAMNVINMY